MFFEKKKKKPPYFEHMAMIANNAKHYEQATYVLY